MPNSPTKILVIDDDRDMRWVMRQMLTQTGFEVAEACAGGPGLELASNAAPDAVLLDMNMPGLGGEEVLRRFKHLDKGLPIIVVTAFGTIPGAIEAIRTGAFEYITKPFRDDQLLDAVRRAVARRRSTRRPSPAGLRSRLTAIMGEGAAIQRLADEMEAVAGTDYSVLIRGETGVGKEVVARGLHEAGPRAKHPFVVVDCGAIVETLTDAEFFGHEKGAYTGAANRRQGWFEEASGGGTIFLDEIGTLPLTGQKALLRALEERVIHRVGGTAPIKLDVRVIAATNDDLRGRAKAGGFREDLFFRLSEYVISVPPLRSRPEDIAFLAGRFLTQTRESLGRPPMEIAPTALDLLHGHDWPGNVRELRNVIRRAALRPGEVVTTGVVADCLRDHGAASCPTPAAEVVRPADGASPLRSRVQDQVREVERDAVLEALDRARGNKALAARLLGIDYKTYRTKLKRLGGQAGTAGDVMC
ncbi:MAG: sigma-54 dependent transcriptional regulator [Caulobacteraceae bacterium]|nr:sigma-54 dependent transcriptional regulator [Caulobacteraceae bacterium]